MLFLKKMVGLNYRGIRPPRIINGLNDYQEATTFSRGNAT